MKIDNDLSFADLMAMKEFLEKELKLREDWRDSCLANQGRYHKPSEFLKRFDVVVDSGIEDKIKLIDNRIQEIIRVSFF